MHSLLVTDSPRCLVVVFLPRSASVQKSVVTSKPAGEPSLSFAFRLDQEAPSVRRSLHTHSYLLMVDASPGNRNATGHRRAQASWNTPPVGTADLMGSSA